jgi:hypothetical protein
MMTNVACFCGCIYFFDAGEGSCPQMRSRRSH